MEAWISRRLRVATRAQQCAADADALAWISQPITRDRYREFLIRIYGIEAPLESAFAMTSGLDEWVASARRKLTLLVDDLRALDLPPDRLLELPRCAIAPFRDRSDALGWVHVLGANTTNRQILARRIGSHALPMAYFASHDRPAHELVENVESPHDATAVLEAALDAYACQHRWLADTAPRRHTNVAFRQ
jgi:heme oxygenase